MTATSVALILAGFLQCTLLALLVWFGIWLYHRLPLRSLPWIGIYLFLTMLPMSSLNSLLLSRIVNSKTLPIGWSGSMSKADLFMQLTIWSTVASTLSNLAVAVFLLSDVVFLLSKAGIELDKKPVRQLLFVREFSFPVGLFIIVLALTGQLLGIARGLF